MENKIIFIFKKSPFSSKHWVIVRDPNVHRLALYKVLCFMFEAAKDLNRKWVAIPSLIFLYFGLSKN